MGNFQSKLGALGIAVAIAALCAAWTGEAEAQTPPLLRLSQLGLSECNRDLPSNPRVSTNAAFPSAREIIAAAYRDADANGGVQLDSARLDGVERATNECAGGLQNGQRYVVDAYQCAADGNRLLARQQRNSDSNYRLAACRYGALALITRRTSAPMSATAEVRLGDVLSARSNDSTVVNQAILAYQAANGVHQTHAAYESLARVYTTRNEISAADGAYAQLLSLRPSEYTGAPRAAALAGRARLRVPNRTPSDLELWQQSLDAHESGEAAVELGKLQISSDPVAAQRNFELAAARTWPIGPSGTNYQLEAFYELSVLRSPAWGVARPTRASWDSALSYARRAESSQPRYRRQICLAHIAFAGADYVAQGSTRAERDADRARDDDSGRVCTEADSDAEGLLLRGMYWLRRAQYVPSEDRYWIDYLTKAETAFREGQRLAVGAANVQLRWARMDPNAPPIYVRTALDTGMEVVNYVRGRCDSPNMPASDLFTRFDVVRCFPRAE